MTLRVLGALLLGASVAFHAGPSSAAASFEGFWAGTIIRGSEASYAILSFGSRQDALTASFLVSVKISARGRPIYDESLTVLPATAFPLVRVRAADGTELEGVVRGDEFRGTVRGSPAGMFTFRHIKRLEPGDARRVEGVYRFPEGDEIVVLAFRHQVRYMELPGGRTGRLLPTDDGEFWMSPAVEAYAPGRADVEFVRKSASEVPSAMIVRAHGRARRAERRIPYEETDVTVRSGDAVLAGTLRIPRGPGPFPGLLMLHGSNQQPRNGYLGLDGFVADLLTRRGIATVLFDKRGVGESTGTYVDDNYDAAARDAVTEIGALSAQSRIDRRKIGVWGISQGGQLTPIVAAASTDVAFAIDVSGSVINSNEQEVQRTERFLRFDGFPESQIADAVAFQRAKFRFACKRDNWDAYAALVTQFRDAPWFPDPYVGPPITRDAKAWDFWRCGVEPGLYWERFTKPALALFGEFEAYSSTASNVERLEAAMRSAGNEHYEIVHVGGVNHDMMRVSSGSLEAEMFATNYDIGVPALIADWVRRL